MGNKVNDDVKINKNDKKNTKNKHIRIKELQTVKLGKMIDMHCCTHLYKFKGDASFCCKKLRRGTKKSRKGYKNEGPLGEDWGED